MNEGNSDIDLNDRPVFTAELKPYRSLGHRGHVVLFLIAGAMTFAHMAVFLISGAWPVVMFFGLDFIVLFGAFWLNNRAARARELIALSRTNISIRKVTPSGRQIDYDYNPFWTRFLVTRKEEIGITEMAVAARNRQTDIGSFLHLDERERFATSFSGALARVKRGN